MTKQGALFKTEISVKREKRRSERRKKSSPLIMFNRTSFPEKTLPTNSRAFSGFKFPLLFIRLSKQSTVFTISSTELMGL